MFGAVKAADEDVLVLVVELLGDLGPDGLDLSAVVAPWCVEQHHKRAPLGLARHQLNEFVRQLHHSVAVGGQPKRRQTEDDRPQRPHSRSRCPHHNQLIQK